MKKQRKQYAPDEKVAILRRHLLEKEPISKLCDELGLQPTVFYRWQKELFENGHTVRAGAPQTPHILRGRLISSRGCPYDSPGTTWFMEEKHDLTLPRFAQPVT